MTHTIKFKSIPSNWEKEYLGLKTNTVRVFNPKENDVREEITKHYFMGNFNILNIEIENTQTNEIFVRTIKDITLTHIDKKEVWIYSW